MADNAQKVLQYKETVKKQQAEDLINNGFPRKIVELNDLLATPLFSTKNLEEVHQDLKVPVPSPIISNNHDSCETETKKRKLDEVTAGTPVLVLPTGIVPCNSHIRQMIKIVKPYIWHLVEDANLLKMWISFLIPKIEDGNNFGVSIQEDMLAEIRTVESEAAAFFDQISRYFITRGKIVTKVTKYPHVEDFRVTVEELDEKEYVSLKLVMCEIRNHYSTLHDIIMKNLEKIKKPRTSNVDNLY
ncbi:proteasome activator complex subunit 3 isoform X1 [Daphnia magna]|uniref:proteasome activator complex subunit 3 isoform X1 n=1 Tax=Daphnia magna TaxID=35525 RepID=UPI0006DE5433|nr:proteasome activator complex subunit 3 isoform X1 [Daphnia magna]